MFLCNCYKCQLCWRHSENKLFFVIYVIWNVNIYVIYNIYVCVEICRTLERGEGGPYWCSSVLIAVAKVICCVIFTTTSFRRRNGYPASERDIQIFRLGGVLVGKLLLVQLLGRLVLSVVTSSPPPLHLLPLTSYADFAFTTLDSNFDLCSWPPFLTAPSPLPIPPPNLKTHFCQFKVSD